MLYLLWYIPWWVLASDGWHKVCSITSLRTMSHLQFYCTTLPRNYCMTKSQVWHGVSRNSWTVAQILFRIERCSILCNFVARMRWTLICQFLFMRQSCSVRHAQLHTETLLHDEVVQQNCHCDIGLRNQLWTKKGWYPVDLRWLLSMVLSSHHCFDTDDGKSIPACKKTCCDYPQFNFGKPA